MEHQHRLIAINISDRIFWWDCVFCFFFAFHSIVASFILCPTFYWQNNANDVLLVFPLHHTAHNLTLNDKKTEITYSLCKQFIDDVLFCSSWASFAGRQPTQHSTDHFFINSRFCDRISIFSKRSECLFAQFEYSFMRCVKQKRFVCVYHFFLFIISVWFSVFALYRCLFLSFIWENLRLSCSNWQRLVNEDHRRAGDGQRIHLCICKNRRREQKNNNLVPMARSVAHTMNQMNKWIRAEGQKIGSNNNNQMETIINAGVEREKCIDCSNKQRMRKSKEREKYQWMLLATTQFVFNFHINWKRRILNIKLHLVMLELFFLLCFCKIIACDS